jgi:hypothetical protein
VSSDAKTNLGKQLVDPGVHEAFLVTLAGDANDLGGDGGQLKVGGGEGSGRLGLAFA